VRAARKAKELAPSAVDVLDVCCGTGDFSISLKKSFGPALRLTCADLSSALVAEARARVPDAAFVRAEAKELPFSASDFDLVTISFATRNLNIDRDKMLAALREFRRVLKPGGLFLNLETTRPENPAVWFLMRLYVRTTIGLLNLLTPKNRSSYLFLRATILDFYSAAEFSALLVEAGFSFPSAAVLFPGAVAIHTAQK
jgi:demethylmenaquinone methyltransferase/2-methoxy-6-polyprenyl-1,4-benzoquinol methylase